MKFILFVVHELAGVNQKAKAKLERLRETHAQLLTDINTTARLGEKDILLKYQEEVLMHISTLKLLCPYLN